MDFLTRVKTAGFSLVHDLRFNVGHVKATRPGYMKPLRGSESWSHCVELIMRTIAGQRGSHSMCYSVVHVQRDIECNVTEANR